MKIKDTSSITLLEKKALSDNEKLIIEELQNELDIIEKTQTLLTDSKFNRIQNILNYELMQLLNTNQLKNKESENNYYSVAKDFYNTFRLNGELKKEGVFVTDNRSDYQKALEFKINEIKINKGIFNL